MQRSFQQLYKELHAPQKKMAFLVGPRQVGKTTLAESLLKAHHGPGLYKNWDDLQWRKEVSQRPYAYLDQFQERSKSEKLLLVLDEIHKFPRWKAYLKGLWDTRKNFVDVFVTGSGRLDIYQRGGDSLLGRYHQYRLHPLSLRECLNPNLKPKSYSAENTLTQIESITTKSSARTQKNFDSLLKWGGFPEPYLAQDENQHRLWVAERRRLVLREDLRDLSRIQLLSHIEALVELLIPRAGGLVSSNSLREDLQVAPDSVKLWMDYLRRLFFIYFIRPYSKNIARSLKKEPKVYFWDWSEIPDRAARFENMVASHLLKWCHFTQDWGYPPLELHFLRDKEKREVDFLITKDKMPWLLVEAKISNTTPSSSLHYFAKILGVKHKMMVVCDHNRPGFAGDTLVIDGPNFLASLPL